MGWMERRRQREQESLYREAYANGQISLNALLRVLGLPEVPEAVIDSPRPAVSTSVIDGGVMGVDSALTMASAANTVAKDPNWRDDWDTELAKGDSGLAALLWGRNMRSARSARNAADDVECAGWRHPDVDSSVLIGVLAGNDCRDFGTAQTLADLVLALGWERHEPGPGVGYMGFGSNPLTEDEEAAVLWRLNRGHDPVHLFNSILSERPLPDPGPQQGMAYNYEASDASADYVLPDEYADAFRLPREGEKAEDPRQPWFIVAELHEAVASLLLDPDEGSVPHCREEYNAGLYNALSIIREQCEALGGTIDLIEPGGSPEPSPEPLGPDTEAMREALRKAGQKMLDDLRPLISAARLAGLVQQQPKIEVPRISEEEMERIGARVAETIGPLLAAVAGANVKRKPPRKPKADGEE